MKKIAALILALAMLFALSACGDNAAGNDPDPANTSNTQQDSPSNSTPDPGVERKIVVGIAADPSTFAPWEAFNQGIRHIFPMLYQSLISDVRDPETGNIVTYYTMITDFEQTSDVTYVLHLREGIYDTNGNPFTANDVVYSIMQFKQGTSASNLAMMTDVVATDELTVEITVSDSLGVGEFEEMLTVPNMVTQASFEASPDGFQTTPVGTTGYKMTEYVPGSHVIMEKADSYWNEKANETKAIEDGYVPTSDTTNIDTVEFQIITDTSTMAIALETGSIDLATAVASSDVPMFAEGGSLSDDFNTYMLPDNMYGLIFNCSENSVFSNINLRKAVAYSISAQDLLDMIYDGDGFILKAYGMDYQIGYVDAWDDQDYFSQDLDKAQQYLDAYLQEAGKSAKDISVELITMSTDAMNKYAQVIQAAMIKLTGNDKCCNITQYDSATYPTMRTDPEKFDLAIMNSMSNKTYITYMWQIYFNGYTAVRGDDLCNTGDTVLWDLCEKAKLPETFNDENVNAFQQRLNEQCYFVNYICGPSYWAGSNFITNYVIGPKNSAALCGMSYDWSLKS